ncbi:MAG: hypothetical protein AAF702_27670 [Chloroflexota bacterium]
MVFLTLLSAIVVLVFLGVVAIYLVMISRLLEAIGGTPTSYLAKLRLGLRAIETETAHLPVQVTKLNAGLKAIADGLSLADEHMVGTIDAVVKQDGKQGGRR